jgi:hypothetical protein
MVQEPNSYTFKTQIMLGLPIAFMQHLVTKGVTAEKASMSNILKRARLLKEGLKIQKQYNDHRHKLSGTSEVITKPSTIQTITCTVEKPRTTKRQTTV